MRDFIVFLQKNAFILPLAGAIITYLLSLIEKIKTKKITRATFTLLTVGLLLLTGQLVVQHIERRQSAHLSAVKDSLIQEIHGKVKKSLALLEQLYTLLNDKSPALIGVELTKYVSADELRQFAKGDIHMLQQYKNWLDTTELQDKLSCLTLTVHAYKYYDINILLTYIMANSNNPNLISERFSATTLIERFGLLQPKLDYIIFYEPSKKTPIGYANARLFSRELLLYESADWKSKVEKVLNENVPDSLFKYFSTVSNNVILDKDGYSVAKEMIDNKINEAIAVYEGEYYYVSLAKIVRFASEDSTNH